MHLHQFESVKVNSSSSTSEIEIVVTESTFSGVLIEDEILITGSS